MRWIIFHGVFGDWGWEQVDEGGGVVAESPVCFESRKDAEADAMRHGCPDPASVAATSTASSYSARFTMDL